MNHDKVEMGEIVCGDPAIDVEQKAICVSCLHCVTEGYRDIHKCLLRRLRRKINYISGRVLPDSIFTGWFTKCSKINKDGSCADFIIVARDKPRGLDRDDIDAAIKNFREANPNIAVCDECRFSYQDKGLTGVPYAPCCKAHAFPVKTDYVSGDSFPMRSEDGDVLSDLDKVWYSRSAHEVSRWHEFCSNINNNGECVAHERKPPPPASTEKGTIKDTKIETPEHLSRMKNPPYNVGHKKKPGHWLKRLLWFVFGR